MCCLRHFKSPKFKVQSSKSKVQSRKSKLENQKDIRLSTLDFRLGLIRMVMNVHRLDTDAPRSSHAGKVHARAAEESSG